jgi:hypothetical protein
LNTRGLQVAPFYCSEVVQGFAVAQVTTGSATVFARRRGLRAFVIPTGGRNLLVAGIVTLQATVDSSTAKKPFRNDKRVEIEQGWGVVGE